MIFTPLPGEYIASAIRRGNELLGVNALNKNDYYINRISLGLRCSSERSEIRFPSFLVEHGIAQQALNENTLYPLTAALGRTEASCFITPIKGWKICLDCVIEDVEVHGTAYIHRRNIPMPVSVCSTHGSKLYTICPTCSIPITKHKISQLVFCSRRFKESERQIHWPIHFLSIFVNELLEYDGEPFDISQTEMNIHAKLGIKYQMRYTESSRIVSIIRETFSLDVRYSPYGSLVNDICTIFACLAYETAAEYLHVMRDENASKALRDEFRSIPWKSRTSRLMVADV